MQTWTQQAQSKISRIYVTIKIRLTQDPFARIEESNRLDILLDELERLVYVPKGKKWIIWFFF